MVKLLKISNNEFVVSGVVDVLFETTRKIIHEGEEYSKITRELIPTDIVRFMEENPKSKGVYQIYHEWLNIDYKVYYPNSFYGILSKFSDKDYSTNEYVNLLCKILSLEKNTLIEKFYTEREFPKIQDFKNLSIPVVLVDYGFQNKLIVEIPFNKLIGLDWSKLDSETKSQLKEIFLKSEWSRRFMFWKNLIPKEIFKRRLTLDEINFTLMELYQRKVKLFREAKIHYNQANERNQYLIEKLN